MITITRLTVVSIAEPGSRNTSAGIVAFELVGFALPFATGGMFIGTVIAISGAIASPRCGDAKAVVASELIAVACVTAVGLVRIISAI